MIIPFFFLYNLEMSKKDDIFSMAYSTNGKDYVDLGKVILNDTLFLNVGFGLTSFNGSQFYIRVKDISIDETILL